VVLKLAHVIWIIVSIIFAAGMSYESLRAQTDENTRQIREMQDNRVTREVYQQGQEATTERLKRIESKLDNQDVRTYRMESELGVSPTPKRK
jgi:hypothetical protein